MRPGDQLARTAVALAIGARQGEIKRELALRSTRSGEYVQQVQLEVSGQGEDGWGWADIPVGWEHPFVYSPLQRDPPFETPHVASHIEITGDDGQLVIALAHVRGWRKSPEGWFTGATVRVAVQAPGGTAVPFTAVCHLTFQGRAYPTDEELST